jgi:hypothetical protein
MVSERTRSDASQALVRLRESLPGKKGKRGITQQSFATQIYDCAIGTIARWETTDPPAGEALLKLRQIAHEYGLRDIADTFQRVWLEEVHRALGHFAARITLIGEPGTAGLLVATLPAGPGTRAAKDFLTLLQHYESGKEPYKAAAIKIFKAMQDAARTGKDD